MTGFEPRIFGVESERSTTWVKTICHCTILLHGNDTFMEQLNIQKVKSEFRRQILGT